MIGGLAFAQPPSWAAPPDNDDRADAIRVDPPPDRRGALIDATVEPGIDDSGCATLTGRSVPVQGAEARRDRAGPRCGREMDAVIDLYRQGAVQVR